MKKAMLIILALALALTVFVLAGCASEESTQPADNEDAMTQSEDEDTQMTEDMEDEDMDEDMEDEMAVLGYMDVSPQEAKALIDNNPNLIVIDVSPHYAEGHLPGAVSYYMGDGSLERAIPTLDPEAEYLVYCHTDSVSMAGAQALVDAGFENVYRLAGNYAAWVAAGYPVEM